MPTIPQRGASAFAALCGRYGGVTRMAQDREQSRQSLYREAEQVVDGVAARARIDEFQRQLADRQAEVSALETRLKRAIEVAADKQEEFATVAQAEGISLSVARRRLRVMTGPRRGQGVATLGRVTLGAGKKAGPLLKVLDEVARPVVTQGAADEIVLAANRS